MRVAFFSPLNPERSGISDYSEELLPYLGDLAEVDLVTGPYTPENPVIAQRFRTIGVAGFLENHKRYDAVFYQIGNSYPFHGYMLPCMRAVPGITVLHDYSLSYLVLGATLEQGQYGALRRSLELRYGDRAATAARRLLLSLDDPYEWSLAAPVIGMSKAIIAHNRYALDLLRREYPATSCKLILHGIAIRPEGGAPAGLRAQFGLRDDDLVVASVTRIAYNKRLDVVLQGVRRLGGEFPRVKLLIVGPGVLGDPLRRAIRDLGLEDTVVQTGWVPWDTYRDLMRASDIVVALRYPTAGETSGSALRAMEAGRPLIVNAHGPFLDFPDAGCLKVPVGDTEAFCGALHKLASDPGLRRRMGSAGRQYVVDNLQLSDAARDYLEFAAEIATRPATHVDGWFPPSPGSRTSRVAIAALYKSFRFRYVYRHYGMAGVLSKIRQVVR